MEHEALPFYGHATFWLWISMAIFLSFAGKPIVRGIRGALDARREAVRTELAAAERLRNEAQALFDQSQQQHQNAVKEAEGIIATAKEDAERIRAEAAEKLKQALAVKEQQALAKIAEAEAAATREARDLATQLALAASRDVLRQRLSGAAGDALIDQAIADLPQKLAS